MDSIKKLELYLFTGKRLVKKVKRVFSVEEAGDKGEKWCNKNPNLNWYEIHIPDQLLVEDERK